MRAAFPVHQRCGVCLGAFCCAIFLLAGLVVGRSALAEGLIASPEADWPQWRGLRRDGISQETGLLATWPTGGPRLLWKKSGLGTGWSSPVISGQQLFITGDVGSELIVFALDRDGNLLWRSPNGQAWTGSYPGARASCCYSEGRVFHLNAHGRLVCLDAAAGTPVWTADILERFAGKNITWALSESLLIDESRVIVTPGGKQALMAALDKRTGETVWTTPPLPEELTSHCSPIFFELSGHRVIANCSAAHGFGVDAGDGALLWTVPLKNQFGVNTASPIYGAGAIFFVTPYTEEGRLYRLRHDDAQFVPAEMWRSRLDTVTGSGVLVDGMLYAAGYRRNKWWMGMDWQTGEVKTELKDLTTGAAIYADGRLYCLDEKGAVGLVAIDAGGLRLAGTFPLVADRVNDAWAHPVLLDGRLYLRYHDTLYCYDVAVR
ncbi:MAG: outer membrane protein assembly factor BamB family protein [Pirellulaceae bacterium]